VNQPTAAQKFVEHAQQVLRRIDTYETSGAADLPARDLIVVKKRLRQMIDAVSNGGLPPVAGRHAELSRMIMDQWPLGHSLGNSISTVEREYMSLPVK
jgi:hypothetical protein